ncbi:hypothetical protein C0992_010299 [Termitomyces sp. T32_za158]|nr:hypothetical protein C0992_010299 [Termitomyces sp. T32_za158]
MGPIHLSMISDRLDIALGAVQSTITFRSRPGHGHDGASKTRVRWNSHRPYNQKIVVQPRQNKRRIADLDRDSLSSIEGPHGSETLMSAGASLEFHPYYTVPSIAITLPPQSQPTYVFTGNRKIVANIAELDYDAEEGTSDTDTDTYYSYEGTQLNSPVDLESSTKPDWAARHPTLQAVAPCRDLIECVTALSPPPLHHSGKTRSKVVSIPRDSPGTCR